MVQPLESGLRFAIPHSRTERKRAMRRRTALALGMVLGLLGLASGGCGSARGKMPELGKVKGKVTYNGSPVRKGTVSFVPIPGKGGETGQSALGEIGPDGSFELTTFDTG